MPRGVNSKGRGQTPLYSKWGGGRADARPSKTLNGGELGERTGACPPPCRGSFTVADFPRLR